MELAQPDQDRQKRQEKTNTGDQRWKLMIEGQIQPSAQEIAWEKFSRRTRGKDPRFDEPSGSLHDEGLSEMQPGLFQPRLFTHGIVERLEIVKINSIGLGGGV